MLTLPSGRRLIQQLLSESVVIGVTAGIVGLGAGFASLRLFVHLLPADTPRIQDVSLHTGDVVFTLCASIIAGLIFGLIPSIKTVHAQGVMDVKLHSVVGRQLVESKKGMYIGVSSTGDAIIPVHWGEITVAP